MKDQDDADLVLKQSSSATVEHHSTRSLEKFHGAHSTDSDCDSEYCPDFEQENDSDCDSEYDPLSEDGCEPAAKKRKRVSARENSVPAPIPILEDPESSCYPHQVLLEAIPKTKPTLSDWLQEYCRKGREIGRKYSVNGKPPLVFFEPYFPNPEKLMAVILLHFPPETLDHIFQLGFNGELVNATITFLLNLIGPNLANCAIFDLFPFKAKADSHGIKWFREVYGPQFVEECKQLTTELLLKVTERYPQVEQFVSFGKPANEFMKQAAKVHFIVLII